MVWGLHVEWVQDVRVRVWVCAVEHVRAVSRSQPEADCGRRTGRKQAMAGEVRRRGEIVTSDARRIPASADACGFAGAST